MKDEVFLDGPVLQGLSPTAARILYGDPPLFIDQFGHIEYKRVMRQPLHWRLAYTSKAVCEFRGCYWPRENGVVFDHCHRHGWTRGTLCYSCNVKVGRLESVMRIEGITVDLGETGFASWLARCPDCPGDGPNRANWLPAKPPFAPEPVKQRPRPGPVNPGCPIARPGKKTAHLRADDRRTLCGLVTDVFVPAPGLTVCLLCAQSPRLTCEDI